MPTTTPTENRVKGSQPKKAIAAKKSPIQNSKGNGAQGSEEATKELSPVHLTNEEIHQSLHEISKLQQRMQAQREKLMEEASLRGLMEEDAESWDAEQAELIADQKGQLALSGED